jgi:hypothetical protein
MTQTPKEKADELVGYFRNYRFYIAEMDCRSMAMRMAQEVLDTLYLHFYDSQNGAYEFWLEVKNEIIKRNEDSTKANS